MSHFWIKDKGLRIKDEIVYLDKGLLWDKGLRSQEERKIDSTLKLTDKGNKSFILHPLSFILLPPPFVARVSAELQQTGFVFGGDILLFHRHIHQRVKVAQAHIL